MALGKHAYKTCWLIFNFLGNLINAISGQKSGLHLLAGKPNCNINFGSQLSWITTSFKLNLTFWTCFEFFLSLSAKPAHAVPLYPGFFLTKYKGIVNEIFEDSIYLFFKIIYQYLCILSIQTIGVLHYLYCSTVLHYYFPVLQCNALQFENMESNAKLHYFFEKVAVQGLHYFFCIWNIKSNNY